MKNLFLLIVATFFLLTSSEVSAQQSEIKEENWQIKTYPFSDPDPIPILTKKPQIYPYFDFNQFSLNGKKQSWKVVTMENPFIRLYVLPKVGGKVYGSIEKSTGKEFIYLNHVLKFRQISLRGPWTSGGIEFNFGIVGHAPSVATPVDYLLRQNPDSSVSCIVGALDLASRTRWSVTITLPKDKAFFETRALWYNPSPLHQSYYAWMNAAVKAGNDLQYFYPGRYYVPHSLSAPLASWPIDTKGRDLSWYKNNNFGAAKGYFILGEHKNYYGGYWHNSHFGFGHWAHYDDVPGRKIFMWALSRAGGIWEDLLTDTDGQYSECQAGRLFSQADHEYFTPYTGDVWSEIWFPIKEIGGLVQASPYAALNVTQKQDSLFIAVCALQRLNEQLIIKSNENEIFRTALKLDPMTVFKKVLSVSLPGQSVSVTIGDKLKYSTNPDKYDVHRPLRYSRPDETSAEGLYLSGQNYEKQRQYNLALQKYKACVERDTLHTRALVRIAELYYRRAEYEKGLDYATHTLNIAKYDADANYVYGILARRLGHRVDAKETLGWAARSLKYRSNAYCQLGGMNIEEKNYSLALEYAQRALKFNTYNLRALEIEAIAYRKLNQPSKAEAILNQLQAIDPLNHLVRFERYLLESTPERLHAFKSMIRNELPAETYLELAISYANLNLSEEATLVLRQAPAHPIVYYWLAYLQREQSQSGQWLAKAQQLSPRLIFPFREETIPVLQWAYNIQKNDWKARYYLALIYWGKGREQEARQLFAACGQQPDFAYFYLNFGYLEKKLDEQKTLSLFKKALSVDDNEWRIWHTLVEQYDGTGQYERALQSAKKALQKFPHKLQVQMDYARSLLNNGRYRECLKRLDKMQVLPYEGAWEGHHLFVQAWLQRAIERIKKRQYRTAIKFIENSKDYPEHLGTGQPFDPDYRLQYYLAALCYQKSGEKAKALARRKEIYDYTIRNWVDWGSHHFYGALVLKEGGETEKAGKLLRDWQSRQPDNLTIQWYIDVFNGDEQKAQEIATQLGNDQQFQFEAQIVKLIMGL